MEILLVKNQVYQIESMSYKVGLRNRVFYLGVTGDWLMSTHTLLWLTRKVRTTKNNEQ